MVLNRNRLNTPNENIIHNNLEQESKKKLDELKVDINYEKNFIDKSEDWLNLNITRQNKKFFLENIWSDTIYITINWVPYWEYKWDKYINKYILQDHKDWNIPLEIKKGIEYTITLNEKVINHNYKPFLREKLDIEDIKELYKKFTDKEWKIEALKSNILSHVTEIIQKNKLQVSNDEYVYYVDKTLQRGFLILNNWWKLEIIWYQKVSTGNPKRKHKRHFETPDLIIDRTKPIREWWKEIRKGDWRSIWTDRKWYWERWSKILNLWEYHIDNEWNAHNIHNIDENWKWYYINKDGKKIAAYINFHFAMHKTTPWATTQLWKKLSQGCIRSAPFTIDLLDSQNILNWEKWKYIIVWDYNK